MKHAIPLPDVADVVERLAIRTTADFDLLYRAAQHVLAEELSRRQAGLEPAALELLVEQAVRVVEEGGALPPPFPEPVPTPPPPAHLELRLDLDRDASAPGGGPPVPSFAPAVARRPRRLLAVFAVLLGVGLGVAALVYLLLGFPTTVRDQAPAPAPTIPATEIPTAELVATAVPQPPPGRTAEVPAATPSERAAARPTEAPAPHPSPPRSDLFATRDWGGAPFFAVHFSSYREREKAEHDAAVLADRFGLPARALEADLGKDGIWYRVMVGEFPTREEAMRFREALAARKTPDLGHVFEVVSVR